MMTTKELSQYVNQSSINADSRWKINKMSIIDEHLINAFDIIPSLGKALPLEYDHVDKSWYIKIEPISESLKSESIQIDDIEINVEACDMEIKIEQSDNLINNFDLKIDCVYSLNNAVKEIKIEQRDNFLNNCDLKIDSVYSLNNAVNFIKSNDPTPRLHSIKTMAPITNKRIPKPSVRRLEYLETMEFFELDTNLKATKRNKRYNQRTPHIRNSSKSKRVRLGKA